jgi:hypothetical protein
VERAAVIAFVVITSILNLGLGYALALYVGRARTLSTPYATDVAQSAPFAFSRTGAVMPAADPLYSRGEAAGMPWPAMPPAPEPPATILGGISAPIEQAVAATTRLAVEDAAEQPEEKQTRSSAAEQDLLAGIEEFRNQLAQLKGMAAPVPA